MNSPSPLTPYGEALAALTRIASTDSSDCLDPCRRSATERPNKDWCGACIAKDFYERFPDEKEGIYRHIIADDEVTADRQATAEFHRVLQERFGEPEHHRIQRIYSGPIRLVNQPATIFKAWAYCLNGCTSRAYPYVRTWSHDFDPKELRKAVEEAARKCLEIQIKRLPPCKVDRNFYFSRLNDPTTHPHWKNRKGG